MSVERGADKKKKPVVLVIGMAGSGKTSFVQRLQADMVVAQKTPYVINLDPAVLDTPYEPNVDIRDTVNYSQVMERYGLGPNGAIMTSLNLFATKWDQVLDLLEANNPDMDMCIVDTPGQIEIFTWSASGAIISESCAATFPTCIAYIVDVARCSVSPTTFMSNMLYACSIMYKCRLPFILVLNKTDLCAADKVVDWLKDYYAFQEALEEHQKIHPETAYIASLMQSMGLVLEEFYENIKSVPVSAFTGDGIEQFQEAVAFGVEEYYKDYYPEMQKRINEKFINDELSQLNLTEEQ